MRKKNHQDDHHVSGPGSLRRRLLLQCGSRGMEAIGRLEILVLDVVSCPCYRCRRRRRSLTWGCARARAGGSDPSTMASGSRGNGGAGALRSSRGPWRPSGSYSARRLVPGTSERTGACAPAKRAVVNNDCLLRSAAASLFRWKRNSWLQRQTSSSDLGGWLAACVFCGGRLPLSSGPRASAPAPVGRGAATGVCHTPEGSPPVGPVWDRGLGSTQPEAGAGEQPEPEPAPAP
jgi:hypothetical protein